MRKFNSHGHRVVALKNKFEHFKKSLGCDNHLFDS